MIAASQQRNSLDGRSLKSYIAFMKAAAGKRPAALSETAMWVLLLLPFVGLLWVPFFNFTEPSLFGFPFFYWYQLAWVPVSSFLIWLVYRRQAADEAK